MIVGIVGGGQLARMLALAAHPLGLGCLVLDPDPGACARQVAQGIQGAYDDPEALARLADTSDVVTFDFENVPEASARHLAAHVPVYPPPAALGAAQDRLVEKTLFRRLGIPTPPFAAVDGLPGLEAAVAQIGLPAVLKTRRLGYDGKGQRVLRAFGEVEPAWRALGGVPLILEGFVDFRREVSVLAVRGRGGETVFYPLVENRHRDGILRRSRSPCAGPAVERQARDYAGRLLAELGYVGVLAVELFERDGALLANEMAPRVHNSGHWSIEGAEVSQFENHLRAVADLPLGSTDALGHAAMVNFIGELPPRAAFLAETGAHYHDYGKTPRPGRKLGHGTVRRDDPADLEAALERLQRRFGL